MFGKHTVILNLRIIFVRVGVILIFFRKFAFVLRTVECPMCNKQ